MVLAATQAGRVFEVFEGIDLLHQVEEMYGQDLLKTEDAQEGLAAFLEEECSSVESSMTPRWSWKLSEPRRIGGKG